MKSVTVRPPRILQALGTTLAIATLAGLSTQAAAPKTVGTPPRLAPSSLKEVLIGDVATSLRRTEITSIDCEKGRVGFVSHDTSNSYLRNWTGEGEISRELCGPLKAAIESPRCDRTSEQARDTTGTERVNSPFKSNSSESEETPQGSRLLPQVIVITSTFRTFGPKHEVVDERQVDRLVGFEDCHHRVRFGASLQFKPHPEDQE